jgi:membrane protein
MAEDWGQDWRSAVDRKGESGARSIDWERAREVGRGRQASTPQQIPARGWRDILWRVLWAVPEDRLLATAGGVAFFALLAVFPAIATLVALYGLFADATTMSRHLSLLAGVLPGGALTLVALWSANSGMAALFDALNVVYKEKEKRSLVRFYAITFLFTLAAIVAASAAIGGVVALPVILNLIGLATPAERLLAVLRWPVLLMIVMLGLALVYRYGPSRRPARWRWVSWGSVTAALLWVSASMLFSWYVASFDSYNKVYGSLGAGVGFMTWIWLSAVIVLFGAELDAEMEHQTAMDTTEGPPRPLGARGAHMADHVGPAQG